MIKQKRKEKAGKWNVPLPKVRGIAEDEMFKVVKTGKNRSKFFFFPVLDQGKFIYLFKILF